MKIKSKKIWKWLAVLVILLLLVAAHVYTILFPAGPILDEVPNPVRNRAAKDWAKIEAEIPINEQRNLYWGDMHVHTAYSFDAFIGGIIPKPDDAYRFAKGDPIKVFTEDVRIQRPLDFAAVTDHSEYLGELYTVHHPDAPAHAAFLPRYFRSVGMDTAKQIALFRRLLHNVGNRAERSHLEFFQGFETTKSAWDVQLKAVEDHYEPGKFTTFAAYEWTLGLDNAHAHRNVFFKDMMVPDYPVSALEVDNEVDFWRSLERFREEGATVLAIPHNMNISEGTAFPLTAEDGSDFDKNYLEARRINEPLAEVHQAKGNSEVHPQIWQEDEFSNFEVYTEEGLDPNNYMRHILKRGIDYKAKTGINPYQYGLIASTDTHNGTPGNTEEGDEYRGNHAFIDYNAELRRQRPWILNPSRNTRNVVNPGGLMAVWSKANTRTQIYEAMEQKETYATSGTRIQVRFFAGVNLKDFEDYEEMVELGYSSGVPMGQSLSSSTQSPTFYIWAGKDPSGANLDRVQMIKGWIENGEMKEKIFNVLISDERDIRPDGTVASVDNALDLITGEWDENTGAIELSGTWTDPSYIAGTEAFYYLRVLEVPTPRWSLYDQIQKGMEFPEDTEMIIQERAWSSPIWIENNQ